MNPQFPSATQCGPPGYECTTKSEVFAKNINALHQAREEFIKAESSCVLKKALKSRVYARGENIKEGDHIYYYKGNNKDWQGPDKVIAVNGKKLFVDKGAHVATVNRDYAVKRGEEFWNTDMLHLEESTNTSVTSEVEQYENDLIQQVGEELVQTCSNNNRSGTGTNDEFGVDANEVNAVEEHDDVILPRGQEFHEDVTRNDFHIKDIRKGHILNFIPGDSDKELSGKVLSRAGKVGGKYESWWNIRDNETGEEQSFDSSKFRALKKIQNQDDQVEEVFVVQIPRYLHNEPKCVKAKEKELANWDEFAVYEEVADVGQKTLGTNWMLVEKVIDGELAVKARLCVRGDQEESIFRTDSPTVHKNSINIFFMLAATNGWRIQTSDVKCAFLQGEDIDREVFVKPPKERRIKGVIWKMLKRAYGLTDASSFFYLELLSTLNDLRCIQSKFDPAVYLYYGNNGSLDGIILSHVDDLLHGSGSCEFYKNVMEPLKKKFQFGLEEKSEFRYVGMHVKQLKDSIVINQDHYVASMDVPSPRKEKEDEIMDEDGQSDFRSLLGRIGWLGNHSRPDLVFDHISLSTRLGKATGGDYVLMLLRSQRKL